MVVPWQESPFDPDWFLANPGGRGQKAPRLGGVRAVDTKSRWRHLTSATEDMGRVDAHRESFQLALEAGIPIVEGADARSVLTPHPALVDELVVMREYGMSIAPPCSRRHQPPAPYWGARAPWGW